MHPGPPTQLQAPPLTSAVAAWLAGPAEVVFNDKENQEPPARLLSAVAPTLSTRSPGPSFRSPRLASRAHASRAHGHGLTSGSPSHAPLPPMVAGVSGMDSPARRSAAKRKLTALSPGPSDTAAAMEGPAHARVYMPALSSQQQQHPLAAHHASNLDDSTLAGKGCLIPVEASLPQHQQESRGRNPVVGPGLANLTCKDNPFPMPGAHSEQQQRKQQVSSGQHRLSPSGAKGSAKTSHLTFSEVELAADPPEQQQQQQASAPNSFHVGVHGAGADGPMPLQPPAAVASHLNMSTSQADVLGSSLLTPAGSPTAACQPSRPDLNSIATAQSHPVQLERSRRDDSRRIPTGGSVSCLPDAGAQHVAQRAEGNAECSVFRDTIPKGDRAATLLPLTGNKADAHVPCMPRR